MKKKYVIFDACDSSLNALRDALATLIRWQELHPDEWDERDQETLENIEKAIEKETE